MPSGDSADALREVWMEGYNRGLGESGRKSAQRADEAQDEVARLACENAALRKRVEELDCENFAVRTRAKGWRARAEKAEQAHAVCLSIHKDCDGCLAAEERAEQAVRERDDWRAAATTHIETIGILSDQKMQLQADLDAALVLCVASDWDVKVLGLGYEPSVLAAHARVSALLAARKEEKRG